MLPVARTAGVVVLGRPHRAFAPRLVASNGLIGVITPYAPGTAPVDDGSGSIARRDVWRPGFVPGLISLGVLPIVGIPALLDDGKQK